MKLMAVKVFGFLAGTVIFNCVGCIAIAAPTCQDSDQVKSHPMGCKVGGLIWSEPANLDLKFAEAENYCASLPVPEGSKFKWTLPSQEQFESLGTSDRFLQINGVDWNSVFWSSSSVKDHQAGYSMAMSKLFKIYEVSAQVSAICVMMTEKPKDPNLWTETCYGSMADYGGSCGSHLKLCQDSCEKSWTKDGWMKDVCTSNSPAEASCKRKGGRLIVTSNSSFGPVFVYSTNSTSTIYRCRTQVELACSK